MGRKLGRLQKLFRGIACTYGIIWGAALFALATSTARAATCEDIATFGIEATAIDAAVSQPAGTYQPLGAPEITDVPAFCRIHGVISRVRGSRIGFELWLPQSGWNGKLEMFGNGGYSSKIGYANLARQLRRGYATLGTDTGHTGDDPSFAVGNPESIVDWGHRAVHESVTAAKAIVNQFYGEPARHNYFWGCSTGGQQAFMEAQRYPKDFDGIIAGDPGHNRTHLNAGFLWQFLKSHRSDGSLIIPPTKLAVVATTAIAACHGRDGGLPGDAFLTNPELCNFKPEGLKCAGEDQSDCLTDEQVEAFDVMYGGARNSRTGEVIYYGWPKGSENSGKVVSNLPGWSLYWADPARPGRPARTTYWTTWAFNDQDWDWRKFDFDAQMKAVDDKLAPVINAMNPDLSAFRAAGGKMIHYHGLADPVVPPRESIDYYERVQTSLAGGRPPKADESSDFYRLFLAPGLEHCEGGAGPDVLDTQSALERWVESKVAPETISATKFKDDKSQNEVALSRPLCPYPAYARYNGNGEANLAASFACAPGPRFTRPIPAQSYLR